MAKKKKSDLLQTLDKWAGVAGKLFSSGAGNMLKDIGKTVDRTIKDFEKKIEKATVNVIKASLVFILMFIGLVFALVGLAQYISTAWQLQPGFGLIIVGAVLILLGMFAKAVRP